MPNDSCTKKGFISLVLAISFIYVVFLLLAYYLELKVTTLKTEEQLIILKNYNSRELELKRAVINTIHYSLQQILIIKPDANSEEVSKYIAANLALFESEETNYYNDYHIKINFWCGFIENETNSMKERILNEQSPIKCSNCKDFRDLIPKYSPNGDVELVPACAPFISYDRVLRQVKISSPPVEYAWIGERQTIGPAVGISILDPIGNISSVVVIPEGTVIISG